MALQRPISRPAAWKKGQSGNPKGKPKGTKSRRTLAQAEAIAASGLTPLEFMLEVLRHPKDYSTAQRMWAANAAAPYVHRKMPIAVEGGNSPIKLLNVTNLASMTEADIEKLVALLDNLLPGV